MRGIFLRSSAAKLIAMPRRAIIGEESTPQATSQRRQRHAPLMIEAAIPCVIGRQHRRRHHLPVTRSIEKPKPAAPASRAILRHRRRLRP